MATADAVQPAPVIAADAVQSAAAQARSMLDALASMGVEAVAITYTDLAGRKVHYWPSLPLGFLRGRLPVMIASATRTRQNVIIRPEPPAATALIQLDDLPAAMVDRPRAVAFMALETSPGNFQAWVAVAAAEADADLSRRLRRGTGADANASSAARVAGSINFKERYAPDFPLVRLVHSAPGRITSRAELEALGVVAAPEPSSPPAMPAEAIRSRRVPWAWPDYQRCLAGAPLKHDGSGPDRSRADYFWCRLAAQWGWPIEATAAQLMELSEKARENGPDYARRTAQNAAMLAERKSEHQE